MEPDEKWKRIALWSSVYNRPLTIILTVLSSFLAAAAHWYPESLYPVLGIPVCSVLIVIIQVLKMDTVSRRFSKDAWAEVEEEDEADGERSARIRFVIGQRFKGAPFQLLKETGPGSYKIVTSEIRYYSECGEVVITITPYDQRFNGLFLIGGPLS